MMPKIAIRKRRFFSYPVILRGLMPRRISNWKTCLVKRLEILRCAQDDKIIRKEISIGNFKWCKSRKDLIRKPPKLSNRQLSKFNYHIDKYIFSSHINKFIIKIRSIRYIKVLHKTIQEAEIKEAADLLKKYSLQDLIIHLRRKYKLHTSFFCW